MNHLAPRTRALLDQAREDLRPGSEDLLRLRTRLKTTLAAVPETRTIVAPFLLLKVLGGLALPLVALAAWPHLSARPVPPPPAPPAPTVALVCPPAPQPLRVECPAAPACPVPAPVKVVAAPVVAAPLRCPPTAPDAHPHAERLDLFSKPLAPNDRWEMELGLLTDARVALDEGRPLGALMHVQRHQQLFPHSSYEEERVALEVLSYCALERKDLAAGSLAHLMELAPDSSYLPRVHDACGALRPTTPEGPDHEE